jgi:hypothetical protein
MTRATSAPASNNEGGEGPSFLKAKIRIGSCKGPVSYTPEQAVFHHDDIPEKARKRASEIREWAKAKTLSIERKIWTKSTKPKGEAFDPVERRTMENYARDRSKPYQYNYRSEVIDYFKVPEPLDKPTKFHISRQLESEANAIKEQMRTDPISRGMFGRVAEMPVHPNLVDAPKWQISTMLPYPEQYARLDSMTRKAMIETQKARDNRIKPKDYLTPIQQTIKIGNEARKKKLEGTFNVSEGISFSTKRAVTEPADPKQFKNRQAVERDMRYTTDQHSGKWEYNKVEKKYMWSDTGSFDMNSKGDILTVINPHAFNFEGPTDFRDSPKNFKVNYAEDR